VAAREFDRLATSEEIEENKTALLDDERFFGICEHCHERKPLGWMSGAFCHGCNHSVFGAVY
jgi:hypothetical protein